LLSHTIIKAERAAEEWQRRHGALRDAAAARIAQLEVENAWLQVRMTILPLKEDAGRAIDQNAEPTSKQANERTNGRTIHPPLSLFSLFLSFLL
jgi:hypothetical protein